MSTAITTTTSATTASLESINKETAMTTSTAEDTAPSGFILKLFQMVNGAPDEIITWTREGDAFVIGSDLKRLEAETLPQFFRHNRFQSLVRQLNFYSFRKINRERNIWVYQHSLFHRDRPEDLHLVRRRTCLGLDGRKQRFGRAGSDSNGKPHSSNSSIDTTDQLSTEGKHSIVASTPKKRAPKREASGLHTKVSPAPKRVKPTPTAPVRAVTDEAQVSNLPTVSHEAPICTNLTTFANADTRVVSAKKSEVKPPVIDYNKDDVMNGSSLLQLKYTSLDARKQSAVVSEVAMKLDQYARKANKSTGSNSKSTTRTRGSGVVTPPYNANKSVLTYDDDDDSSDRFAAAKATTTPSYGLYNVGFVSSDGEDSLDDMSNSVRTTNIASIKLPASVKEHPILARALSEEHDSKLVDSILSQITKASTVADATSSQAKVAIVKFCLTSSPQESDKDLFCKILQVLSSCSMLKDEFQSYRSALHPTNGDGAINSLVRDNQATTLHQIWQSESNLGGAVRDFKTFAVNCIRQILNEIRVYNNSKANAGFDVKEKIALQDMAKTWVHRSVKQQSNLRC